MAIASNTNCKPCCSKKGTSCSKFKKVVPYEEMERLMNVYGALTAVRNRGAKQSNKKDGESNNKCLAVKRDSIKRKFYRWFPDLEARFSRTEDGTYQPIHGHEEEVKYRKEMREKSFESVAKKRARANQRNNYLRRERGELPRGDQPLPEIVSSSGSLVVPPLPNKKVTMEAEAIIASLVSEDEDESSTATIDNVFHASESIFDEVNKEFYGEGLSLSATSAMEIDSSNFSDEKLLEGIIIGSGSSTWEEDLELFGDGLLNILEDESV